MRKHPFDNFFNYENQWLIAVLIKLSNHLSFKIVNIGSSNVIYVQGYLWGGEYVIYDCLFCGIKHGWRTHVL